MLWPEHFDVAVTEDEVNYGVSPGDDFHPLPYAYVGPWTSRIGVFWNAPFGAFATLDPSHDVDRARRRHRRLLRTRPRGAVIAARRGIAGAGQPR